MKKDLFEKGAVVQRDRETYAITPHLPAGLVTPDQLRQIAEVAERYQAQLLKMTSAQRIAIIGVKEEDIDEIWQDLDLLSQSRPHGPCVRNIKICPGTDCCKRGQQDSILVGKELDRLFQGKKLPWKMKLGVSGCMNDCAEVCLKDLGLIGTSKGWHLQIGGNGGAAPRLSQRLFENIPTNEAAIAAVERIIDWFSSQERKCRLGKIVAEHGVVFFNDIGQGYEEGSQE